MATEAQLLIQEALGVTPEKIPERLWKWRATVERPTGGRTDTEGNRLPAYATLYTGLRCAVITHNVRDVEEFGQRVSRRESEVYFPQMADGTLPDIRDRDRLNLGTAAAPEYLSVDGPTDLMRAGLLLVVKCSEKLRG